jgi:hypothetical protein
MSKTLSWIVRPHQPFCCARFHTTLRQPSVFTASLPKAVSIEHVSEEDVKTAVMDPSTFEALPKSKVQIAKVKAPTTRPV